MEEAVANVSLVVVSKAGREFPIEVIVGKPRPHEERDWVCSVTVMGLDSRPRDICGADSLQALMLGLRQLALELSGFVEAGGQLLDPEKREPFPLGAYFPKPEPGAA